MSKDELEIAWEKCCVRVDNVKSKEDFDQFMAEKMDQDHVYYEEARLPFMWYLIPNDGK